MLHTRNQNAEQTCNLFEVSFQVNVEFEYGAGCSGYEWLDHSLSISQ